MIIEVELKAFGTNEIRKVDVPDEDMERARKGIPVMDVLERVFFYGQNDFQPRPQRSVSVGDVIRYEGGRYELLPTGFRLIEDPMAGFIPPPEVGIDPRDCEACATSPGGECRVHMADRLGEDELFEDDDDLSSLYEDEADEEEA